MSEHAEHALVSTPEVRKVQRLRGLLREIKNELDRFITNCRSNLNHSAHPPNLEAASEAAKLLIALGLAETAARLRDLCNRFDRQYMDVVLCDHAKGKPTEYRRAMVEVCGDFPAPLDSNEERTEIQNDRRLMVVGRAAQLKDYVQKLQRELARGATPVLTDVPDERGYVESPVDPTAYVPAADIVAKHTPPELSITMKELGMIVEDYDCNRVRWTRPVGKSGRPMKNRRSVHLGGWAAYLDRRTGKDPDGFPRQSKAETERRIAAVNYGKQTRK